MSITSDLKSSLSNILLDSNSLSIETELKQIILKQQSSDSSMKYILGEISQDASKFILLRYFIKAIAEYHLSFEFFSDIYTILQGYVNQRNFNDILSVFEEISRCFSVDNDTTNKERNCISHIETAIGFCLFNLRENEIIFQQIGSLCLLKLIKSISLNQAIIKTLFKNIIEFLENSSFKAISELLSVLDLLIQQSNTLYSPYATITLFKALDFQTASDDLIRKTALKVIYDLVYYCNANIFDLKQQIIEFASVLKGDPNEEVREISTSILKSINQPSRNDKTAEIGSLTKESVLLNEVIVSEENISIEEPHQHKTKGIITKNIAFPQQKSNVNYTVSEETISNNHPEKEETEDKEVKRNLFKDKDDNSLSNEYDDNNNEYTSPNNKEIIKDEEESYYENQITDLLKQMKEISNKQIDLIDVITSLKNTSQEQIAKLNGRITTLESHISDAILKAKSKPRTVHQTLSPKTSRSFNASFSKALSASDQEFISAMENISPGVIDQLSIKLIEDCINRLTTILSMGSYIHPIIIFIKHFLVGIKFTLKKTTISNLSDTLSHILSNKTSRMRDQDIIDITLLQSYLHCLKGN